MNLIGIMGLLFIGAFLVFAVDPFYHYHGPWFKLPVTLYNEIYQTAGVARNFEYDSAIIGSSMTENFHVSWFDEDFGWDTVKLCYEGARTDDLKAILEQVFEGERQVEHVILAVDDYQMISDSTAVSIERPEYLYNDDPFDDVNYLFNRDALKGALQRIWDGVRGKESEVDDAYNFSEKYEFSTEQVLRDARPFRENILANPPIEETPENAYLQMCQDNLENILPFVEGHPETEFIVFFSPYSILNWEKKLLAGTLKAQLNADAYVIRTFLSYDNVRVFYFQDEYDMITDLEQYMDTCHYKEEYNHYIEQCIKNGKNEVTLGDYRERIERMYEIVSEYDYENVWEGDWFKSYKEGEGCHYFEEMSVLPNNWTRNYIRFR